MEEDGSPIIKGYGNGYLSIHSLIGLDRTCIYSDIRHAKRSPILRAP